MTFPFLSAATAGLVLILQMILAATVSGARGSNSVSIGDGGKEAMLRPMRRHGNLAENAGIFVTSLALLELARPGSAMLVGLCGAFVLARLFHAIGLSMTNTDNIFRLIGGAGTYLTGLVLGGTLLWIASPAVLAMRIGG